MLYIAQWLHGNTLYINNEIFGQDYYIAISLFLNNLQHALYNLYEILMFSTVRQTESVSKMVVHFSQVQQVCSECIS